MRLRSTLAIAVLVSSLALAPSALAQRRAGMQHRPARPERPVKPSKTPIDEFERMTPEERQRALDRLPPQQRKQLQERLQKFNQLPPEQQQNLRNMYTRLNQLPPEQQGKVREAINKFSQEPPGRQQAMREELRNLATLPQEDRQSRLSSPEFKSKFSGKEQQIVRQMSDLLPPGA